MDFDINKYKIILIKTFLLYHLHQHPPKGPTVHLAAIRKQIRWIRCCCLMRLTGAAASSVVGSWRLAVGHDPPNAWKLFLHKTFEFNLRRNLCMFCTHIHLQGFAVDWLLPIRPDHINAVFGYPKTIAIFLSSEFLINACLAPKICKTWIYIKTKKNLAYFSNLQPDWIHGLLTWS